jgi:hypothetical protein
MAGKLQFTELFDYLDKAAENKESFEGPNIKNLTKVMMEITDTGLAGLEGQERARLSADALIPFYIAMLGHILEERFNFKWDENPETISDQLQKWIKYLDDHYNDLTQDKGMAGYRYAGLLTAMMYLKEKKSYSFEDPDKDTKLGEKAVNVVLDKQRKNRINVCMEQLHQLDVLLHKGIASEMAKDKRVILFEMLHKLRDQSLSAKEALSAVDNIVTRKGAELAKDPTKQNIWQWLKSLFTSKPAPKFFTVLDKVEQIANKHLHNAADENANKQRRLK